MQKKRGEFCDINNNINACGFLIKIAMKMENFI